MDLFSFLDLKYRQSASDIQKQFNIYKDGRLKAIHSLIGLMRSASKWASYPLVLGEFFLVKLHFISPPEEPKPIKFEQPKKPELVANPE